MSDIHVEPQAASARIRFRIDGNVWDVSHLSKGSGQMVINQFKAMAGLNPIVCFTPRDAHANVHVDAGSTDLRLALTPCQSGEALSLRLLDPRRLERTIDDLGLNNYNLDRLENALKMFAACSWRRVRPAAERQRRFIR